MHCQGAWSRSPPKSVDRQHRTSRAGTLRSSLHQIFLRRATQLLIASFPQLTLPASHPLLCPSFSANTTFGRLGSGTFHLHHQRLDVQIPGTPTLYLRYRPCSEKSGRECAGMVLLCRSTAWGKGTVRNRLAGPVDGSIGVWCFR